MYVYPFIPTQTTAEKLTWKGSIMSKMQFFTLVDLLPLQEINHQVDCPFYLDLLSDLIIHKHRTMYDIMSLPLTETRFDLTLTVLVTTIDALQHFETG